MRRSRLLPLLLIAAAAAGCRPERVHAPSPAGVAAFPVTVRDDSGRSVTIPAQPRRIVSLAGAHTETLYALGAGERVVAADRYSDYPPEAREKAVLNCWPHPPAEQILALRPDLVVVFTEGEEFARQMSAVHVPVLKLFPTSYQGTLERIRLLGRAIGSERRARELTAEMQRRLDGVRERLRGVNPPRVMYEIDASDPSKPYVAGGRGVYGELLPLAGGRNIFQDSPLPAAQVSTESVVARDPQVILLGDSQVPLNPQRPDTVRRRPGWQGIAAVRSGRIYPVAAERMTRPGPRLVDGVEEVARLLHPERFR